MTTTIQKAPLRYELSGVLIEHTSKRMKHAFAKILSEQFDNKITVDQWVVLYQIFKHGALSQFEIAAYTYKDAPTVTRIIDILLSKELILKALDEVDRRKFTINISQTGIDLAKDVLPALNLYRETCYENISENELALLEKILNKINQNIL
jgi:DNA-binding MarR family transcriptional regulator